MRPVISDSLISGQPETLLYSKAVKAAPGLPSFAALALQAIRRVRLQVTGRPPTCSGLGDAAAFAFAPMPTSGRLSAPPSSWRRRGECSYMETLPKTWGGPILALY